MRSNGTTGESSKRAAAAALIAIDGPVASGKTAVGSMLARELGYRLVDTGMMYRAVTWAALQRGVDINDPDALTALARSVRIRLGQPTATAIATISVDGRDVTNDLRTPAVETNVSLVSRVPGVRKAMVARQRRLARQGRIIMLGRDIGTVVLPNAPVKIYLDASREERARRRQLEVAEAGGNRPYDDILSELERRDGMDRNRHVSPLKPAPDAVVIDTNNLTLDDVVARVRRVAGIRR